MYNLGWGGPVVFALVDSVHQELRWGCKSIRFCSLSTFLHGFQHNVQMFVDSNVDCEFNQNSISSIVVPNQHFFELQSLFISAVNCFRISSVVSLVVLKFDIILLVVL